MEEETNPAKIVLNKARSGGLVISRVPEPTLSKFKELASKEFADDYGLLLKFLIDNLEDTIMYKTNVDSKLNYILDMLYQIKNPIPANVQNLNEVKKIKTLSGKHIKGGGE